MHVTRYIAVSGDKPVGDRAQPLHAYRTPEAAIAIAIAGTGDGEVADAWSVEVDLEPPPLELTTLAPDAMLIVNAGPAATVEAVQMLAEHLDEHLGGRFLILAGAGSGGIGAAGAAQIGGERRDAPDVSMYAPPLLEWLRRLYRRHDPAHVTKVAELLAAGADVAGLAVELGGHGDRGPIDVVAEAAAALEARAKLGRPTTAEQ